MRHHLSFVSLLLAASVACSTTEPATAPTSGAKGPPPSAEPSPVAHAAPVESAGLDTPPGTSAPAAPTAVSDPGAPAAISSVNDLTLALLRELEAEKTNVFFSATSLRTALGMTALGAQGATLEEMAQALHVNPDPRVNVTEAQREGAEWKRAAGIAKLHIANRLFVQRELPLAPAFTAKLRAATTPMSVSKTSSPLPSRAARTSIVGSPTRPNSASTSSCRPARSLR